MYKELKRTLVNRVLIIVKYFPKIMFDSEIPDSEILQVDDV